MEYLPDTMIDAATLTAEEIREAVMYNGIRWGSGIRAYRDEYGKLRIYYRRPPGIA